jgi:hypothetical protein
MSRREPEHRVRSYLRRFFTSWVADDPEPGYSSLDRSDGLGQRPDPICEPRTQLPESAEVVEHTQSGEPSEQSQDAVAARSRR